MVAAEGNESGIVSSQNQGRKSESTKMEGEICHRSGLLLPLANCDVEKNAPASLQHQILHEICLDTAFI